MDDGTHILVVQHSDPITQTRAYWYVFVADEFGSVEVARRETRDSALVTAERLNAVLGLPVLADCPGTTTERREIMPRRETSASGN